MKTQFKCASLLLLGVLVASSPALAAQWRELVRLPNDVHYVDMESIQREGQRFSIWELHDYAKAQSNAPGSRAKFKSRVDNSVGDCKAKSISTVKMYFYEESMGKGKVVHTLTIPYSVEEVPPGSVGRELVDRFCAPQSK